MNRLGIVGIVALLVAALFILNRNISHNAVPDNDDGDNQQQSQTTPSAAPVAAKPGASAGMSLLPEETIGDPAHAKHHVVVGWAYDPHNQANPASLTQPIEAIRQAVLSSRGAISAEIVNVDVPASDRSPAAQQVTNVGITMDGKTALAVNPSDVTPSQLAANMEKTMH